jgi:hypothetical protein
MVMRREDYGWKLAGIVEGRLRPELKHASWALRVVPSWCDKTDLTMITVTYHGYELVPLAITIKEIEDNLAEDCAIAWAEALLENEPLLERLPEKFLAEQQRHPVVDAIAAMRTGAPYIGAEH